METTTDEAARAERLLAAEKQAMELFAEIERRRLIAPGRRDREVSDAIRDLAHEMFGVDRFWHKRIVRSGEHTLRPYQDNPPGDRDPHGAFRGHLRPRMPEVVAALAEIVGAGGKLLPVRA